MISLTKENWRNILLFLTPKEVRSISLTSKGLYNRTKENEEIIVKQFHLSLVANQDFFLCSIYQNPSYVQTLKAEVARSFNSKNSDLIKDFATAKIRLNNYLTEFFGAEKAQRVVKSVNDGLTRPKLPPLRLKREFESCETFSLYQNYLNDVYHGLDNESKTLTNEMITEEDIFELNQEEKEKLGTVTNKTKDLALYARWYLQEEIKAATADDDEEEENSNTTIIRNLSKKICKMQLKKSQYQKGSKFNTKRAFYEKLATHNILSQKEKETSKQVSPMIELYTHLHQTFSTYCRIIYSYLSDIKNPFIFISEYTVKWKNFVAAMQTIGGYLRQYSTLINEVYEREFLDYPNHPEFRIWRMMAKIWCNEVFCKLENKMQVCFRQTMNTYLNVFSSELQRINLNNGSANFETDAIPDAFLESQMEVACAIGEFWNSILDMALNERTIFSLTCVDLMNFGLAAGFCSSLHELVSNRCVSIIKSKNIKSCQKFELIHDNLELIEAVIPQHLFPELFEVSTSALQSVLVGFFSEINSMSTEEIAKYIKAEMDGRNNLLKWLSSECCDTVSLSYPALKEHLKLYNRKMSTIEDVLHERERRKIENLSRGFNHSVCEMERTFLDLDKTVNVSLLEQCKAVYC